VNKLLTHCLKLIVYTQFMMMLIELNEVLSQELKCLCSRMATFYFQYVFCENCAFHKIKWKLMVEPDRPQMTM
jgi:hypothetical protein